MTWIKVPDNSKVILFIKNNDLFQNDIKLTLMLELKNNNDMAIVSLIQISTIS